MIDKHIHQRCKLRIIQDGESETVWASVLSDGCFRLENLLFRVYGYAYADIVSAHKQPDEAHPIVDGVVRRSAHSAYRIFLTEKLHGIEDARSWELLEQLQCTFERASKRLYAIDVPSNADIHATYQYLQQGELNNEWEFEEVFCGHVV